MRQTETRLYLGLFSTASLCRCSASFGVWTYDRERDALHRLTASLPFLTLLNYERRVKCCLETGPRDTPWKET